MKFHNFAIVLTICTALQMNSKQLQSDTKESNLSITNPINAPGKFEKWKNIWIKNKQALTKSATAQMSKDEQIQHQVNMILEWAKTKKELDGEKELEKIKDTVHLLNPRPGDNDIIIEAKKRAKEQLFPTSKSYWKQYAPQVLQNATESTKNYIASWIPQFIKNRIYPTSTITQTRQILGKTQTIIIKNPEKLTAQELQNLLGIKNQLPTTKLFFFHTDPLDQPQSYKSFFDTNESPGQFFGFDKSTAK